MNTQVRETNRSKAAQAILHSLKMHRFNDGADYESDYGRPDIQKEDDELVIQTRFWGRWTHTSPDYDWEDPLPETQDEIRRICKEAAAKFNVEVTWNSGEKYWLYVYIK
jgi:hypothetical protein